MPKCVEEWRRAATNALGATSMSPEDDGEQETVSRDPEYHPLYPCTNGSAVLHLQSKDKINFCVYAVVLISTSGFFKSLLSLPKGQDKEGHPITEEVVYLEERSSIVEFLLNIATGKGMNADVLSSVELVMEVLGAADKYEMPGVLSVVRLTVLLPDSPFSHSSLQLALVSYRYNWDKEYRVALARSLSEDISDPDVFPLLRTLNSAVLVDVMQVRWNRIEMLKRCIAMSRSGCSDTDDFFFRFGQWRAVVVEEFTRYPSGHTLMTEAFLERFEVAKIFDWYYPADGIHKKAERVDKGRTVSKLKQILESLPTGVDLLV